MTNQEKNWFKCLRENKIQDFKVFNKPEYKGLFGGVVNMYSQKTHFIYELLQNADDAHATMASFEILKDGLYFRHNGKVMFTVSDPEQAEQDRRVGRLGSVNSITAIGYSTKSGGADDTTIKIGKFGVGFKAVFQYTDTPMIYNTNISFRIDNFIIPTLIEEKEGVFDEGFTTCFYLPFNSKNQSKEQAYQEISTSLRKLKQPILFLQHLIKLECRIKEEEIVFEKSVDSEKSFKKGDINARYIRTKLINGKSAYSYFWFFDKKIKIEGSTFPITVGYELYQNQTIKTEVRPYLHCFFPVNDKLDMCLYLNAPFELVSNRQNITQGDINNQIFDELSSLAARTLLLLRDIGSKSNTLLLNDNIFKIVVTSDEDEYGDIVESLSPFYDKFLEILQNEAIFITEDGKYVTANEGIVAPDEIMELMNKKQLNEFIEHSPEGYDGEDFSFVYRKKDSKSSDIDKYLEDIGIREINQITFAREVTTSFLEKQDESWLKKLFEFINSESCNSLLRPVKQNYGRISEPYFRWSPIIRLSNGTFTSPYKEDKTLNVFLPSPANYTTLNIIDDRLLTDDNFKEILKKLDIKQPDEWDYIKNVIFPKGDVDNPVMSDEEMVEDLYVIYNHYMSFRVNEDNEREEFIKECSKHWILCGAEGKDTLYCLPDIYIKSDFLDKYFNRQYKYLREDVYRERFGQIWDSFLNFLDAFGVNKHVKLKN